MNTVKKVLESNDLDYVASEVFDINGGFGDLIQEAFNNYHPGYVELDEVPDEIVNAMRDWLAKLEVKDDY